MAIFDALVARRAIAKPAARYRGPVGLGPAAAEVFGRLEVDLDQARAERRQFATACVDWTERRPHLGGALGAALWVRSLEEGWVARRPGTRIVVVTPHGRRGFHKHLGIRLEPAASPS